jgi:hypothetical protein
MLAGLKSFYLTDKPCVCPLFTEIIQDLSPQEPPLNGMRSMKHLNVLLLIFFTIAGLQACAQQATPEKIAQQFWDAVVNNNKDAIKNIQLKALWKTPHYWITQKKC